VKCRMATDQEYANTLCMNKVCKSINTNMAAMRIADYNGQRRRLETLQSGTISVLK
jgi:hypothetical protein